MLANLFMLGLLLTGTFLIILVLIQRGKGGGLAGAFGGLGGQSAFGTKAGDLFTRITIGVAAVWIVLCMLAVKFLATTETSAFEKVGGGDTPASTAPGPDGATDGGSGNTPATPE